MIFKQVNWVGRRYTSIVFPAVFDLMPKKIFRHFNVIFVVGLALKLCMDWNKFAFELACVLCQT